MSFDPTQDNPAPVGHAAPPKKSGALKWVLGGVGCIGLLGVLCFAGFGYFGYQTYQRMMNNSAYLEARATLESSASLGDAIGNPITVGDPIGFDQGQTGERIQVTYTVPVSGPNGSGTAEIKVDGNPFSDDDWTLESLSAEVDGQDVPLDGGGLDINIEGE